MEAEDGAGAVGYQRARPQQWPPHSMGAGVGAEVEETQQQRQLPQQEREPSVVTEGAAAATSAMDRCIPAAEGPTGDRTIPGGCSERERWRRHSRGASMTTSWCRRLRQDRYSSSGTV